MISSGKKLFSKNWQVAQLLILQDVIESNVLCDLWIVDNLLGIFWTIGSSMMPESQQRLFIMKSRDTRLRQFRMEQLPERLDVWTKHLFLHFGDHTVSHQTEVWCELHRSMWTDVCVVLSGTQEFKQNVQHAVKNYQSFAGYFTLRIVDDHLVMSRSSIVLAESLGWNQWHQKICSSWNKKFL